ncbi:MAG: helix-turn-helix domain-containing protein [Mycobacteriales bacterium]
MLTVNGVDVLDVRGAATYVNRTPETVRRWVWSGRVSAVRQGNRLLIPRAQLDAAVSDRDPGRLSLREWAESTWRRGTDATVSAAPLVLEDRADDHRR